MRVDNNRFEDAVQEAVEQGTLGQLGDVVYDAARLDTDTLKARLSHFRPELPALNKDRTFSETTIADQVQVRAEWIIDHADHVNGFIATLPAGYRLRNQIGDNEWQHCQTLIEAGWLSASGDFVYDPLQIGEATIEHLQWQRDLVPIREEIVAHLEAQPGQTCPREDLYDRFDRASVNAVINSGGFSLFTVKVKVKPHSMLWVRLSGSDKKQALKVAHEAVKIPDDAWADALRFCGEVLRPGARDGQTKRNRVVARTYTVKKAARRLGLGKGTLERAIAAGEIPSLTDPENALRIPAASVEQAFNDPDYHEHIGTYERISVREIATVSGLGYSSVRRRLRRARIDLKNPLWRDVRGRWRLPDNLTDFRTQLEIKRAEQRAVRDAHLAEEQEQLRQQREEARRQRRLLRQRLVAAFPTWKHDRRSEQHISMHIGPPNSGKTHDALDALAEVESGWYLAPLRLLAFEVFDRLNARGVTCNLLTGEEYIPIEGATVTAATIEMFNPQNSGECVVIDEAQMLADPDRGWAWTRALMEAEAPEIHVIGPLTVQSLIKRLCEAAGLSMSVVHHKRLSPLRVADNHWPLDDLPPKTILVAFSRRMVLHLKSVLERMGRSVSVIYGGLPPEVRRKQADRFADGETDICVATDAVGMGLNLPADGVCFYEIEKYDGYDVRQLKPEEVHQIGGRAGRYGIRHHGEVSATTPYNLEVVRELYHVQTDPITHARIAPTVEDLSLLPGSLWARLSQWAQLESIPDSLREVIKTADLSERIELARMLTDEEVEQLGLERANKLINAPTRRDSRAYWHSCAKAILADRWMPLPPEAPVHIRNSRDLETTEGCIACADIYLWLASRREFAVYAEDERSIREQRMNWSLRIDDALLRQIDTTRRCAECGRPLGPGHRFSICDRCFYRSRS